MLNEQTIEKLGDLRLRSMARAFREQLGDSSMSALCFDDRFGLIVDRQWSDRKNSHIQRLTSGATFKLPNASVENIDYYPDRKLKKDEILMYASGKYIENKNNIIIMGASGAGKSYIGCALGAAACRHLVKTKYIRLPELLEDLHIARGEGTYKKLSTPTRNIGCSYWTNGCSTLCPNRKLPICSRLSNPAMARLPLFSSPSRLRQAGIR